MEKIQLKGSPKQVAWARNIRKNVIEKMERVIAGAEEIYKERPKKLEFFDKYKATFEALKNEEEASFWIDNFRDYEMHVFVVNNFRRYLNRKGLEDVWRRLPKIDSVATKLDINTR